MPPTLEAAWTDYMRRNRASNSQYRALPIATAGHDDPRAQACNECGRTTWAKSGTCRKCQHPKETP